MKKIKRLLAYSELLIKYEILKKEDKRHIKSLDRMEIENETLRMCLTSEEQRTASFRKSYKIKLAEYEDLVFEKEQEIKKRKSLERKIKKLEKELEDGKSENI